MAAAAVFFVLLAVFTVRFVLGGRGLLIGRFAAILGIYILVWLVIAVQSPGTADRVAGFGAGGASAAITGVIHFIGDMFGSH